jgi:transposase
VLRRAGRRRNLEHRAEQIVAALRTDQLGLSATVSAAYSASVRSLVAVLTALSEQIDILQDEVNRCFGQHPDAEVITSLPGLGTILGARVLAEFGDAPGRFADAKARRNYAGTSPITRASGTKRVVLARYARNKRLADALHQQAFAALTASPGARAYYDAHRARGATHQKALRALANRLVGILHGCLEHRARYDENIAWSHATPAAA